MPMLPILLRLNTFLTLTFALLIGAVRSQPYDDSELRAFLLPQGCEQFCLMGIDIAQMSSDEAKAALTAHPWVGAVVAERSSGRVGQVEVVRWAWSGQQPAFIDATQQGRMRIQHHFLGAGEIEDIQVILRISPHEVYRLLDGQPGDLHSNLYDHTNRSNRTQFGVSMRYMEPGTLSTITFSTVELLPCRRFLQHYARSHTEYSVTMQQRAGEYIHPHHFQMTCHTYLGG